MELEIEHWVRRSLCPLWRLCSSRTDEHWATKHTVSYLAVWWRRQDRRKLAGRVLTKPGAPGRAFLKKWLLKEALIKEGRVNSLGCGGENLTERMVTEERSMFQGQGIEHSAQCDRGIGKTLCSWREVSLRLGGIESFHILSYVCGTVCWPRPSFVLTGSFLQRTILLTSSRISSLNSPSLGLSLPSSWLPSFLSFLCNHQFVNVCSPLNWVLMGRNWCHLPLRQRHCDLSLCPQCLA